MLHVFRIFALHVTCFMSKKLKVFFPKLLEDFFSLLYLENQVERRASLQPSFLRPLDARDWSPPTIVLPFGVTRSPRTKSLITLGIPFFLENPVLLEIPIFGKAVTS